MCQVSHAIPSQRYSEDHIVNGYGNDCLYIRPISFGKVTWKIRAASASSCCPIPAMHLFEIRFLRRWHTLVHTHQRTVKYFEFLRKSTLDRV